MNFVVILISSDGKTTEISKYWHPDLIKGRYSPLTGLSFPTLEGANFKHCIRNVRRS
jgi:hypothetical protein